MQNERKAKGAQLEKSRVEAANFHLVNWISTTHSHLTLLNKSTSSNTAMYWKNCVQFRSARQSGVGFWSDGKVLVVLFASIFLQTQKAVNSVLPQICGPLQQIYICCGLHSHQHMSANIGLRLY